MNKQLEWSRMITRNHSLVAPFTGTSTMRYARHVDGLSISNWRTRWQSADARPAAVFDDVSHLQVVGFHAATVAGQKAVILLHHVSKALIVTAADESAAPMIRIEGNTGRAIAVRQTKPHTHPTLAQALARRLKMLKPKGESG